MLSKARNIVAGAVALACLLPLSGCQAAARAYAINDNGVISLRIVPGCDTTIQSVTVKYLPPPDDTSAPGFDELETVWSVTLKPGAAVQSINLFTQVPDATAEYTTANKDLTREVVISWTEDSGYENGVVGVLADLKPGYVLTQRGVEKADAFLAVKHSC